MQILVSVHTVEEAAQVIAAGVTLLDLKDPTRGALAALPIDVSRDILRFARNQSDALTISATVGDNYLGEALLQSMVNDRLAEGIDVLKFPPDIWRLHSQPWLAKCRYLGVRCIAVHSPESLNNGVWHQDIQHCFSIGYDGVMLDTQNKARSLFNSMDEVTIRAFVDSGKKMNMYVGLAGGMQICDIQSVLKLGADFVGLRGGLCQLSQRLNLLDKHKLEMLQQSLSLVSV